MRHHTDEKKPAGDGHPTAGSTDRAIVPSAPGAGKKLSILTTGNDLLLALNNAALRLWCASPSGWMRGTIRSKAKAPVPEKHLWFSGSSPHRKAGFCFVQILGTGAPAPVPHGFGRDGPTRKDGRTAEPVFFTSRPPIALKTQKVVFKTRSGATTMRPSHLASRRAAPTPTTGNHDPIQLFADAHNALAMASYYLRQPEGNHAGAARKAGQALAALRRLAALPEGGAQ